jgi:hypothetical protein
VTSLNPVTENNAQKMGTFTATIEREPDFLSKDVLLHKFAGENPGGMIIANISSNYHLAIGFPQGVVENKEVTLVYPFPTPTPTQSNLQWSYSNGTTNLFAKTGTIKITLTSNSGVSRATGVFDFITTEQPPRKVSGTFDASR